MCDLPPTLVFSIRKRVCVCVCDGDFSYIVPRFFFYESAERLLN